MGGDDSRNESFDFSDWDHTRDNNGDDNEDQDSGQGGEEDEDEENNDGSGQPGDSNAQDDEGSTSFDEELNHLLDDELSVDKEDASEEEDEDEANFDKRLKEVQKEGHPGNAETNDIQASGGDGKHEIKTSTTKGVNQNRKTFIQAETSLTKNITNKDTYFR